METLWQDLRFAKHIFLKSPGFTLVVVFTLALGVAATTTVATVVSAVLLHSVPYPDPDRLVLLQGFRNENGQLEPYPISYLDCQDWRKAATSFEDLGERSSDPVAFNLLTNGEAERVDGELVDSAYFRMLHVTPVVGRTFTRQDDQKPGEPRIAILGHDLWQRRFGSDLRVLGRNLLVNGEPYQIVGVMPARFKGLSEQAELWLPLTMAAKVMGSPLFLERRGMRWLNVVGRLKPGVALPTAQREIDAIAAALGKQYPDSNETFVVHLDTLTRSLVGDLRFPLLTLLGASTFVLLIAWTTVANLLVARAVARHREISVRLALGAHRRRILRQLVTESLLLAGVSCLGGLALAGWATSALIAASTVKFPSFVDVHLSLPIAAVVFALSLACGLGFGLMPAWFGFRSGRSVLTEGSSSLGLAPQRFQSAMVVLEVALALFLLVGAGLMIKGFQRFRTTDLGFDPKSLLSLRVDLKGNRYADPKVLSQLARLSRERLRTLPGVRSVALEGPAMPTDGWNSSSFVIEDLLSRTKDGILILVYHHVTPGYFKELGIPLLAGREFTEADTDTAPRVIVISEELARKVWPHESALGKRMRFGRRANAPWFTVVGVVGNLNQAAMQDSQWPGPDAYFALYQFPPQVLPRFNYLLRTSVPPLTLAAPVAHELHVLLPELASYDVDSIERRIDRFAAKTRFLVLLMSFFALFGLILAAVGLYGVLFYSVHRRTRELAIRMALGADSRSVIRLVVGRAAALVTLGLTLGLVAAAGLNRLFVGLLYGVSPTDAATLAGTSLLLFAVAMAAAYVPARRATAVQPVVILKSP